MAHGAGRSNPPPGKGRPRRPAHPHAKAGRVRRGVVVLLLHIQHSSKESGSQHMAAGENTMFTSRRRRENQLSSTAEDRTMSATVSRRGDDPRSYVACAVMRNGSVVTIRAL